MFNFLQCLGYFTKISHYYSEEIYDLEMEIIKLKRENDELRKQLKEKEARIIELEQVKSEAK